MHDPVLPIKGKRTFWAATSSATLPWQVHGGRGNHHVGLSIFVARVYAAQTSAHCGVNGNFAFVISWRFCNPSSKPLKSEICIPTAPRRASSYLPHVFFYFGFGGNLVDDVAVFLSVLVFHQLTTGSLNPLCHLET